MANIAVIGFGQGGAVAAVKLARQGHAVTIFEKLAKDSLGKTSTSANKTAST